MRGVHLNCDNDCQHTEFYIALYSSEMFIHNQWPFPRPLSALSPQLKGSLGIVATVTALTGIILHSLDGAWIMLNFNWDYPYYYVYQQDWVCPNYYSFCTFVGQEMFVNW